MNAPEFNQQGYNTFDMSMNAPTSQRFGDAMPSFFMECVPGDRIIHRTSEEIRDTALTDVLLSEVRAFEDVFTVPISSLYPVNWQKMITNPTKGDDLPDSALPNLDFFSILRVLMKVAQAPTLSGNAHSIVIDGTPYPIATTYFNNSSSIITGSGTSGELPSSLRFADALTAFFMVSRDSLLARTGMLFDWEYQASLADDADPYLSSFPYGKSVPLSQIISAALDSLLPIFSELYTKNTDLKMIALLPQELTSSAYATTAYGSYKSYFVNLDDASVVRDWIYRTLSSGGLILLGSDQAGDDFVPVFENRLYVFKNANLSSATPQFHNAYRIFYEYLADPSLSQQAIGRASRYNPSRLIAYHQAMASYYSNASVDYIYTSQLWMQNFESCMINPIRVLESGYAPTFEYPRFSYNGVLTPYDIFTDGFLRYCLSITRGYMPRVRLLAANLFFPQQSLRYMDFFTSSRPNVIAVGDVSLDVSQGTVSAIDTAQSLVKLRFLNAVNRVSSELHSYLQGIFGVTPVNDMPEPHFVSRQRLSLGRQVNTGTASNLGQQNTSVIGTGSTPSVDIFIDEPCILLGIRSFDILGSYRSGINPHLLNNDRYSQFNPLLQAMGDQPIPTRCLTGSLFKDAEPFGYTERYGEYKMPISFATGAASTALKNSFFFFDDEPSGFQRVVNLGNNHIKPSFIRSYKDSVE